MVSVFVAALLATTAPAGAPSPAPGAHDLDLRCYRLMAELAEHDDPQVRSAGITGTQYFLGRLDAAGRQPESAGSPTSTAEKQSLIGRCSELMGAGGRDFRTLGQRLAPPEQTI